MPSRAEVRRAAAALPEDLNWEGVSAGLRPVFVRRRPLPPGAGAPVTVRVELGVSVALGIDIGPAFMYVGPELLRSWPVTLDEAVERAMANLRDALLAERYVEMEYGVIAGVPLWWYQSQAGNASGMLLLEDELARRYGDQPRLLAAPMRNLLLAAPFDADRDLMCWIRDEIAAEDPNGLDLPLFALVDGRLSVDSRSVTIERSMVH